MGRGVSCGGGQSSLGYLFAGGEGQEAPSNPRPTKSEEKAAEAPTPEKTTPTPEKTTPPPKTVDGNVPAGIPGSKTNNYYRADGQNCGNFITDRPTTKVHAAPGGGSSLGYLFGGDGK